MQSSYDLDCHDDDGDNDHDDDTMMIMQRIILAMIA